MRRALRALFAWLWDAQEAVAGSLGGLRQVGPDDRALFRLRLVPYRGDGFILEDGTGVARGQVYGELHLRNALLRSLHGKAERPRQVGFLFASALKQGLRDLATAVTQDPRYAGLPAFGGVTMLHHGAEKLGFEVRRLPPGLWTRLVWLYQMLLTARYHPAGWARVGQGTRPRDSRAIWISRQRLLELYGSASQERGERDEAEAGVAQPGDDVGKSG